MAGEHYLKAAAYLGNIKVHGYDSLLALILGPESLVYAAELLYA